MSRLLIDTNILLLYVVGSFDPAAISRFKRTEKFDEDDFALLTEHVGRYSVLVVTAGVLAEVSNLLSGYLHVQVAGHIVELVDHAEEASKPAVEIMADAEFARLGFTDSTILQAAATPETTVLTDDVQLYLALLAREHNAVNFNHLRNIGN
jgi:hypothetical protein